MTESKICTCPSGDGSLVHPCPAHPAVEQAGGGERAAFELFVRKHCGMPAHIAVNWDAKFTNDAWEGWKARAALAQPSPDAPYADDIAADLERSDWTPEDALRWYAAGKHFDTVNGRTRIIDTGAVASNALKHLSLPYLEMKGDAELTELREAMAQPSPVRSSLLINGYQLRAALDFIAPDGTAEQLESEACIEWRQQDADFLEAGLYAFCAEYPEEGGVLLDEEPATAQPSPLQSEQAEAERPEMSPERAAYFMRRFKSEEKLLGPNEQAAVDYVLSLLAQHDRIVGELRADRDSWAEQAEQRLADWDEMRKERDAALARVEQQERTIAGMNEAHAKLAGLYEAAQAQHSVPELLEWAVDRWHAEVSLRPLINVHRRALDDTWRQVIRRLGGDTGLLCGPSHDELLAAAPGNSAQHSVPEGFIGRLSEFLAQRGTTGKALLRELRAMLATAPAQGGE